MNTSTRRSLMLLVLLAIASVSWADEKADNWQALFDGKSLKNWTLTNFGGESEIKAKDGILKIEMGYPMTGITWKGKAFPKLDYEIELEARRIDGDDFFCGLTFPIENSHASLILGGWGGTVTGISSIGYFDASENETGQAIDYKQGQWYTVRLRVEKDHVQVWLDDKSIVDVKGEKKWRTRPEVDPSKPLGLATFQTRAEIKNFRWRSLKKKTSKK